MLLLMRTLEPGKEEEGDGDEWKGKEGFIPILCCSPQTIHRRV